MTAHPWFDTPARPRRPWFAVALHALGMTLVRSARRWRRERHAAPTAPPVLEFYADAAAPEGALYVDGQLVGHLTGVTRL